MLTQIRFIRKEKSRDIWLFKCDCGKEKEIRLDRVKSKEIKSCGCLRNNQLKTHNLRYHPLYNIYYNIKRRCYNPVNPSYKDYGGRGIKMCDRWKNSFQNFYNDMIKSYIKGLSIDRINNDGNYELSNCRWATIKEQSQHRRNTVYLTYQGRTQNLTQWAKELKINRKTLEKRLKSGWSIEKSFETIVKTNIS